MKESSKPRQIDIIKFAIMSVIGVFLFMVPLPVWSYADGEYTRTFNIPLGIALRWLGTTVNSVEINSFGLLFYIAVAIITLSFLATVLAYLLKPPFIMESDKLKRVFLSHPVYLISKAIAVVIAWMVILNIGPEWFIGEWYGGGLMMGLIAGNGGLIAIFLVVGIAIPILTDFGLMEFLGTLIRKVVRTLFTLPGRSSIDLFGSWFSSSAAGVIITRDQHEKGYYTHREASAICVNFELVSLPFTFVVANQIGMTSHFALFYLVICVTAILLAMLMPRIWPLNRIKDEYLPDVGKQIEEEVPSNISMGSWAIDLAGKRAGRTGVKDVVKSGLGNWLNIFMDLIPIILAWGAIAVVLEARTDIFDWISWPFARYLELLRVPYGAEYASATIVGFIDMFIPALLLGTSAPIETRFILGALSIVQIIYLAETGILILKSKMPLNIGHLAILFVMRTVIALPIIVLFTRLFFRA